MFSVVVRVGDAPVIVIGNVPSAALPDAVSVSVELHDGLQVGVE